MSITKKIIQFNRLWRFKFILSCEVYPIHAYNCNAV